MPEEAQAVIAEPQTAPEPAPASAPVAEVTPAETKPTELPFDPAEVEALLRKIDSAPASEPPTPAPAAEAVPEPTGETPPAEVAPEVAVPAAPVEEEEVDGLPKRMRLTHALPEDRRILAVQHRMLKTTGEKISFTDAIAILNREEQQQVKAAADEAERPAVVDPIQALETEIADLESKITEESDGTLNSRELKALELQFARKVAALETAKVEAVRKTEATRANFATQIGQVKAQVLAEFPNVGDPSSLLGYTVSGEIAKLQQANAAELDDPNVPRIVTERVIANLAPALAKQQGITLEQAKSSLSGKAFAAAPAKPAAAAPTLLPPAAGKLQAAPGNRPAAPTAVAPSLKDILNENLGNPNFDYDSLLGLRHTALRLG